MAPHFRVGEPALALVKELAPAASRLLRDGNLLPKRRRVGAALAFLEQRLEAALFQSELGALGQDFCVQGGRKGLRLGISPGVQTAAIASPVPLALEGGGAISQMKLSGLFR